MSPGALPSTAARLEQRHVRRLSLHEKLRWIYVRPGCFAHMETIRSGGKPVEFRPTNSALWPQSPFFAVTCAGIAEAVRDMGVFGGDPSSAVARVFIELAADLGGKTMPPDFHAPLANGESPSQTSRRLAQQELCNALHCLFLWALDIVVDSNRSCLTPDFISTLNELYNAALAGATRTELVRLRAVAGEQLREMTVSQASAIAEKADERGQSESEVVDSLRSLLSGPDALLSRLHQMLVEELRIERSAYRSFCHSMKLHFDSHLSEISHDPTRLTLEQYTEIRWFSGALESCYDLILAFRAREEGVPFVELQRFRHANRHLVRVAAKEAGLQVCLFNDLWILKDIKEGDLYSAPVVLAYNYARERGGDQPSTRDYLHAYKSTIEVLNRHARTCAEAVRQLRMIDRQLGRLYETVLMDWAIGQPFWAMGTQGARRYGDGFILLEALGYTTREVPENCDEAFMRYFDEATGDCR